jgi:hypothetical protein
VERHVKARTYALFTNAVEQEFCEVRLAPVLC